MPGFTKVNVKFCPSVKKSESKVFPGCSGVPLVTLCSIASKLIHTTVVPTGTSIVSGSKVNNLTSIFSFDCLDDWDFVSSASVSPR